MARLFSIVFFRMFVALCLVIWAAMSLALWLLVRGWDAASPSEVRLLAFGLPAAATLLVLFIGLLALQPWQYLSEMRKMRDGGAWAHWRYDEREWRAANRLEGRRSLRSFFAPVLIGTGLGAATVVAGLAVPDRDLRSSLIFTGALAAAVIPLTHLVVQATGPAVLARTRRRGEIYITPLGVYRRPGGFTALVGLGVVVRGVEFVGGPPPYVRFDTLVQGSAGAQRERWADVLVPAGREDEARRLIDRFRTEVLAPRSGR